MQQQSDVEFVQLQALQRQESLRTSSLLLIWINGFLLRSPLCILGSFQAPLGLDLVLSWAFCHCWASTFVIN